MGLTAEDEPAGAPAGGAVAGTDQDGPLRLDGRPERRASALWIWLGIGAFVVVLQAWIYTRYLASGPEQVTGFRDRDRPSWVWAKLFEASQITFLAITVVGVTRQAVRQRQLTRNAMFLIAFASVVWLDPLLNYFRPGFYFSANFYNVESWTQYIPGSLTPHANLNPTPIIWVFGAYVGFFLPVILTVVKLFERLQRRWPNARLPVLMAAGFPVCFAAILVLELSALRTGVMAYPGAWHNWSIWGGETYQFPLIEGVAAPMFWLSMAAMIYSADPRTGLMPIERGAQQIRSTRRAKVARLLAVVGFTNVMFLALPMGLPQIGVMRTDPFPSGYAPDLHNGWCGEEGQPYGPCPGPGVAWQVRVGSDPTPSALYENHPLIGDEDDDAVRSRPSPG